MVDAVVAGDPVRLEAMGLRQLVAACQAEAARLDVASVVTRRRRAEADRHVSLRPAPETMTWLTALLPVADGVAVYAALTKAADTRRAAGDPRGKGQLMADTLVASVTENPQTHPDPAGHAGPGSQGGQGVRGGHGVALGVVISDQSLFGGSDEPAHLDGYGPIPAELARELITGACTRAEQVWLRRLYTTPHTGELVAMDTRARRFPTSLARFVRLRDQVCRTPWCEAPIRHIDHAHDHHTGGPTTATNAQGLCQACNHAKQAPGWHARPTPDTHHGHRIETTTPTGHHHHTRPPALATIRHVPIRIDYVLTC